MWTEAQKAWNSGMDETEAEQKGFGNDFKQFKEKYGCSCIPLQDILGPRKKETPSPPQPPKGAGRIIQYDFEQKPVEGTPINAAFGGQCHTQCPHQPKIKVGSLSCERCEHFGGREAFAVATGYSSHYGGTSEHRKIYCKKT